MAVWLVRAGRAGENEAYAMERGVAAIGWSQAEDLTDVESRDELLARLVEKYPDVKPKTLTNWRSQLWPFLREFKVGDIVALPLKSQPAVAFGRIIGPATNVPDAPWDARLQRSVEWFKTVPRSEIPQDLLYSLGAFMTVCRIWRNDAENRIGALLEGKKLPVVMPGATNAESDEEEEIDLESFANERIRAAINAKFKGHGLSRLVAAVLEAQGYKTNTAPAGPDGGVDVVAGSGPLGFDAPKLVVQVKSEQSPIDVRVIRELQGVMRTFGADHGLVVAWGGFKSSVVRETARQFFEIRLWSSDDLVQALLDNYDRLPDDIRAELPLKRIWTLVPEVD